MLNQDFKEALADADPIDKLELLFGMLTNLIGDCAVCDERGTKSVDSALVFEVIGVIDFLRTHLRPDHPSTFNLALRKFYRDLRRLIIDANGDGCSQNLDQARKNMAKLLGPMLGHDFLRNCRDESIFEHMSLDIVLMRLHEVIFRPKFGSSQTSVTHRLVTLH